MTASITPPAALAEWSVETRRGDGAFTGLAADWDGLHARCAGASPFQTYAWQHSWWRSYGRAGALRIFLVRHGGRLVGAAAFVVRRRVLTPVGGDLTDFTDVLLDDDLAAPAAQVLATAMVRDRGWHVADFGEARPGAVTGTWLAPAWPGQVLRTTGSLCLELAAGPFDDLVAALPAHSRKTARRRLNQLRKAAPEITAVTPAAAGPAVASLLDLHARQWEGRGGNPAHRAPAFIEHLTRSVPAMIEAGRAELLEYRFDGELLASSLLLIGNDLVGGYLFGVDPVLRGRVDVTTMLLADALRLAHEQGLPTMSMLRGDEAHKSTWRPVGARNHRLLLVRPGSPRGLLHARGVVAARRLAAELKTRAPWLRALRARRHDPAPSTPPRAESGSAPPPHAEGGCTPPPHAEGGSAPPPHAEGGGVPRPRARSEGVAER